MVQTRSKTKKHEENPDDENKYTKMNLNVEVVQKDGSNLTRKTIELGGGSVPKGHGVHQQPL